MYTVKVEVRADVLGNVVGKLTYKEINANSKDEAKRIAEQQAHKENCLSYGVPVHFVAVSTKL
ncbi:hypothetical protein BSK59_15670 [Paenibacillus odorifer]|uniref:hypothetical protein n=1 Tax=Paenibacillus odorifer TaxID=189426 RepID=UPI00097019ED|nr:hypothetical protein [Paenibacillus odorifer]OME54018.1 hypothetical protein BSK59_15670 [Paenibacillus odorifer]